MKRHKIEPIQWGLLDFNRCATEVQDCVLSKNFDSPDALLSQAKLLVGEELIVVGQINVSLFYQSGEDKIKEKA